MGLLLGTIRTLGSVNPHPRRRHTYEYTIADDDGEDYMLLAIVPGEDLNGPVFVPLSAAQTCPAVEQEHSAYWQHFLTLNPSVEYPHPALGSCSSNQFVQSSVSWMRGLSDNSGVAVNGAASFTGADPFDWTPQQSAGMWTQMALNSVARDLADDGNGWGSCGCWS